MALILGIESSCDETAVAIIDGSALSKTGASVAIIASVAAAMLAVGAGVMALRRKRS